MKKCPECGNPSYDGAPVCGNCGYKFPKPKVKAPMQEDIFEDRPIIKKNENEQSTIEIIKDNKIVIGTIILITLIVIGIIIATGPSHNNSTNADGLKKYSDANISFSYPSIWKDANGNDELHPNAVFFEGSNGTGIEYYTVTGGFSSIYDINAQRISSTQDGSAHINTIQPLKIDGKDTSNVIIESSNGTFTRYVSIPNNGNLYVFKVNGKSLNDTTSSEIESVLQSVHIG